MGYYFTPLTSGTARVKREVNLQVHYPPECVNFKHGIKQQVIDLMSFTLQPVDQAPRMNHDKYTDAYVASILKATRVIAVVGASPERNRPSFSVMQFLQKRGFRIIPVNPRAAGEIILGEKMYATLADVPVRIDMVDVFRKSDAVVPVAAQAIAAGAKYLWMQLGVRNDEAARLAEAAGLKVVMNRCSKIEHGRLSGQIGWMGVDTGVINNSRRRHI